MHVHDRTLYRYICRIVLLTLFAIAYLQIRLQSNIVGFSLVNIINNDYPTSKLLWHQNTNQSNNRGHSIIKSTTYERVLYFQNFNACNINAIRLSNRQRTKGYCTFIISMHVTFGIKHRINNINTSNHNFHIHLTITFNSLLYNIIFWSTSFHKFKFKRFRAPPWLCQGGAQLGI